jgi:hopene-associated glycosyltransferase HpnB
LIDVVWLGLPGFAIWLVILLLPWRPWSTRESLDSAPATGAALDDVTVLIPARNESECIARTLRGIAAQGAGARIIVIDDQSSDGTAQAARATGIAGLTIVAGIALPGGWTGKLWALEQGRALAATPLLLLLDADIELLPGTLVALRERMTASGAALVSIMARLRMRGFWERLLMPAFVYFFKLLYPFRLSNSGFRHVAAAAGGCILLKRDVLEATGGFGAVRDALIDDCTLAAQFKRQGHRTWIGLSHAVLSHRAYPGLAPIWNMVARTAYAQLHRSAALLAACTLVMVSAFLLPLAALFSSNGTTVLFGAAALLMMATSYVPLLVYYDLNPLWSAALPAAAVLFLLMTWSSAVRDWQGRGADWKGRNYRGRRPAK